MAEVVGSDGTDDTAGMAFLAVACWLVVFFSSGFISPDELPVCSM